MIRHSNYADLNEYSISGKGVKNEPRRHEEPQELIMTNITSGLLTYTGNLDAAAPSQLCNYLVLCSYLACS